MLYYNGYLRIVSRETMALGGLSARYGRAGSGIAEKVNSESQSKVVYLRGETAWLSGN